jgi:hypothetical protein
LPVTVSHASDVCVSAWTKETIDVEIAKLLAGYGSEFEIRFA